MQSTLLVKAFFALALAVSLAGCFGGGSSAPADAGDGGGQEIDGGDSDSDSDTVTDTDSKDTDDTDLPPAELGDPCWKEILGKLHPNYGLSNCVTGLQCIYNENEAWCSKRCAMTGDINSADPEISGWCCGELSVPCKPELYWLPESMDFSCIPRTAGLAEACDLDTHWNGDNRRCKPICDGTELKQETMCAQHDNGSFCTFQCEQTSECLLEPAFEDGCCGEIMTGKWCLISDLCN